MSNFSILMRRADAQSRRQPENSDWWTGYRRGLRYADCASRGEQFGTETEHQLYLAAVDSDSEGRAALGRGYRAGLTLTMRDPDVCSDDERQ